MWSMFVPGNCFNPRPRAGGDNDGQGAAPGGTGFNPRPRAGGDQGALARVRELIVSIHAPARGATQK